MRPGCVHVTMQAMVDAAAIATDNGAHSLLDSVRHLLECACNILTVVHPSAQEQGLACCMLGAAVGNIIRDCC